MLSRLVLGNRSVYGFRDYVIQRNLTGGIRKYSTRRGFLVDNMMRNYNAGKIGRYSYGTEGENEKIRNTDGVMLRGNDLAQAGLNASMIGDYYSVNEENTNAAKESMTEDTFSFLGSLLRERNTRFKSMLTGSDTWVMTDFYSNEEYPHQVHASDDSITQAVYGTRTYHNEHFGLNGLDFGKDIVKIGEQVRDKYSEKRKTNKAVESSSKAERYTSHYGEVNSGSYEKHNYGDIYIVDNLFGDVTESKIDIPSEGLLEYYREENTIQSKLRDSYRGFGHTYPYGLNKNEEDTASYYRVPDEKNIYDVNDKTRWSDADHKINPKLKSGSFRSNAREGNTTYSYYEEVDGSGPVNSVNPISISPGFTPKIGVSNGERDTIINKVNNLFRENKIKSLINRFHTDNQDDFANDELISSYSSEGISRGRNLLRADLSDRKVTGFDNPYCRVWTAHHQYSTMKDRIRPFVDGNNFMTIEETQAKLGPLRPNNGAKRLSNNSVLLPSGFVKITPYNDSGKIVTHGGKTREALKRYMFSIENLAWKDFATSKYLSEEQIGPFKGRIMWFPPYNLKFTENINTSWRDNEFIGRGEKVYTYANTERGGTLNFTLLIDHPSILNKWRGTGRDDGATNKEEREQEILRYFAGCGQLNVFEPELSIEEKNVDKPKEVENTTPILKPSSEFIEKTYVMFFPNNFSAQQYISKPSLIKDKISQYEGDESSEAFTEMDRRYSSQVLLTPNYKNESLFKLNGSGLQEKTEDVKDLLGIMTNELNSFKDLLSIESQFTDGKVFGKEADSFEISEVIVRGFASKDGYRELNIDLANDRANAMKALILYLCPSIEPDMVKREDGVEIDTFVNGNMRDVNDIYAKIGRSAVATFRVKLKHDAKPLNSVSGVTESPDGPDSIKENENTAELVQTETKDMQIEGQYTYGNEYLYFKEIQSQDNLVYKNIVDKVRFFEPAFHSLTPEGFNARLNFLQQCTRQGPTVGSHSSKDNAVTETKDKFLRSAANLAFGRPPICILRIGDFYYSKIVITSISIDYDNGGGTQWDLNPEGVGVQPMMANISMNFTFIGGQDIDGPVNALQNALTYNYYANSSIYTDLTDPYNAQLSNIKLVEEEGYDYD